MMVLIPHHVSLSVLGVPHIAVRTKFLHISSMHCCFVKGWGNDDSSFQKSSYEEDDFVVLVALKLGSGRSLLYSVSSSLLEMLSPTTRPVVFYKYFLQMSAILFHWFCVAFVAAT